MSFAVLAAAMMAFHVPDPLKALNPVSDVPDNFRFQNRKVRMNEGGPSWPPKVT